MEEIRYEGFAPGGVGLIVEVLTDNRNRAAANVRAVFTKAGGNLGETGSVSFMFDRLGEITYPRAAGSDDAVMEAAIEAGAEDVESDAEGHTIYAAFEDLGAVAEALEAALGPARSTGVVWRPKSEVAGLRRRGRQAGQADRGPGGRRRRAERLRQLRHRRRRTGAAGGLSVGRARTVPKCQIAAMAPGRLVRGRGAGTGSTLADPLAAGLQRASQGRYGASLRGAGAAHSNVLVTSGGLRAERSSMTPAKIMPSRAASARRRARARCRPCRRRRSPASGCGRPRG